MSDDGIETGQRLTEARKLPALVELETMFKHPIVSECYFFGSGQIYAL